VKADAPRQGVSPRSSTTRLVEVSPPQGRCREGSEQSRVRAAGRLAGAGTKIQLLRFCPKIEAIRQAIELGPTSEPTPGKGITGRNASNGRNVTRTVTASRFVTRVTLEAHHTTK
jgi:hypothetical protein